MKKLGVIGGLGPMATAYFYQLIVEMTAAQVDQDHFEVMIDSRPGIPDRTSYILKKSSENPMPSMLDSGKKLYKMGADVIAIPCITAHFFQEDLEREIGCPIIHAIRETADYLKKENIDCVGILATDGTVESRLFQNVFDSYGIKCVIPEGKYQENIMHIIYKNVKAGKEIDMERLFETSKLLERKGAQVNLLGCTELSVAKRDNPLGHGFLDVMEVLASSAVKYCANLRPEYEHLIS